MTTLAELFCLFDGLPTGWQLFFTSRSASCLAMFLWTVVLFARARGVRSTVHPSRRPDGADGFGWIFLVPALNEEVTIRDSVGALLAIARGAPADRGDRRRVRRRARPTSCARSPTPTCMVIRREPPDARRGKAAALNHAYQLVREGCGRTATA